MTCCEYYAGMLSDVVTLLRPHDIADGYGGNTTTWHDCKTLPCQVTEITNKKAWAQDRLANNKEYLIVTRSDSDIEHFCRLTYCCTTLAIISIVDKRNGWLEINAIGGVV